MNSKKPLTAAQAMINDIKDELAKGGLSGARKATLEAQLARWQELYPPEVQDDPTQIDGDLSGGMRPG